ncbi:Ig-like domain repeat protein, partial [Leucobacter weissii]
NARPTFNAGTKKVYVSAYDDSTITVVNADPADAANYGKAEKVIDVTTGSSSGNTGTNAVEVDAERGLLYSANLDAGVTVYDINDDYAQLEFAAEDGSTYTDIPTSGRSVNFGLNEQTGEVWVSTWGSAGKVDVIDLNLDVPTNTVSTQQDQNATVTYPKQWVVGEPLRVKGEGWAGTTGQAGSRVAIKLDRNGTVRKDIVSEPEEAPDETVWQIFDANADGSFDIEIAPFPTTANSNLVGANPPAAWVAGTTHQISLLSGSLGLGTPHESVARGGFWPVELVEGPVEKVWTAEVTAKDSAVKNGYQLAAAGGKVYVADAQWTTADAVGTGKVVIFNAESGEHVADQDFTQLRRNDGIVQGQVTTAPTGKVAIFDAAGKAHKEDQSFLGLSRNDGTGLEGDGFEWDASSPGSQTSMRSTFSPYGIAVDPDVNGETTIVTTTARQRDPDGAGYGGGVVIYNESQGAPTDADRVFKYADGSPVLAGPRRIAIDTTRDRAYVTNLGNSRNAGPRDGYVTVLDLTKRGAEAVIAQVTVPDQAGSVGIAVDEANNLVYVGGYAGKTETTPDQPEKLYVIDGSKIKDTAPADFALNDDAISALDAVVGDNARPTFNAGTKKVYVSAYDDSTITVVNADPADAANYGKAEKVIDVTTGSSSGNTGTNAVEVDAERGLLYSANLDAGVTVYDINDDYAQLEFAAEDGSTYTDIPTSGRSVNFGLNEQTGEVWVSTWGSAGKVDVISVEALASATKTTVSFSPKRFAYNGAATATVRVSADAGVPVGNVSLRINGKTYSAKLANGQARIRLNAAVNPGKRAVTVSYAGATGFEKSSARTTVTVTKAKPKVSVKLAKSKVKRTQRATARVTVSLPGSLKAKPSGKVVIYDGKKRIATKTLKASANGKVSVKLPKLKRGTHKIKATILSNSKQSKATSSSTTLRVVR